jgi:hypothetical protein
MIGAVWIGGMTAEFQEDSLLNGREKRKAGFGNQYIQGDV